MNASRFPDFNQDALETIDIEAMVSLLLNRAADLRASDLYLQSDKNALTIKVRRFGSVEHLASVSPERGRQLCNYVRTLANMDIAERRRPQDGHLFWEGNGKRLDLRVNMIATMFGEDLTLRISDQDEGLKQLGELGFDPRDLGKLTSMLESPSGLILVTGPTGTGKTTTLYSCLQHLRGGSRKINTLEDPIEYTLDGVRQSAVFPKIGLDFAELLRSVMRQAPDVIMVGEIRDEETATTAVRAANSGHLVMATLHAPTAAGAIHSMLAFGVAPYFLSSSLLGILAQRLVRTLCEPCRTFIDMGESPQTFERIKSLLGPGEGRGIYAQGTCETCFDLGYTGRTALLEVAGMNQEIRNLISHAAPREDIERALINGGMIEFGRGALLKVARGETSIEEIMQHVPAEHLGLED